MLYRCATTVATVIEQVAIRTCAQLHDDDFSPPFLLLLDGQQLDDVLVLHLLEDLELAHLKNKGSAGIRTVDLES